MKSRIIVVTEYSRGKTFEEAVENLFKNGLMNGSHSKVRVIEREIARCFFRSWFCEIHQEAEVKYIVVETYDEEHEEWLIDYTEGIEILPCRM